MLINFYFSIKHLETLMQNAKQNGKGVPVTLSVNDVVDQYGNNANAWLSQSKEQREAKEPRNFVGNGKVIFSKAPEIYKLAPKTETPPANYQKPTNTKAENDFLGENLPF